MMPESVQIAGLSHRYDNVAALTGIDLTLPAGGLHGIVGPDGVGKSTLLSIVAGVTRMQDGSVRVLGRSMAARSHRRAIHARIGFMPQGLGHNLYGDLSVEQNLRFFASLFEVPRKIADVRMRALMTVTDLAAVARRRADKLSGGMKQKLGLCAILVREPELVILDEPTTGVDPLSRRNFWRLIRETMRRAANTTFLVATAYMDEAEGFDSLAMMDAGRILAAGTPTEIKKQAGATTLDDAYVALISHDARAVSGRKQGTAPRSREIAIQAIDLTRRFGDFTAVDQVNFEIRRGEIYGFIGPNGSGKTTTMKMLTGLLPPSAGSAQIFGADVKSPTLSWRRRLGYMSQAFSLYSELTVEQNLRMHGRLFDLPRRELAARVAQLARQFELTDRMNQVASDLPIGIRQRLSLAVAVIHQPSLLVLDEPTSGVDPVARDKIWATLRALSDDRGATIFVSTHYLDEAERCDRVALMKDGRLLAVDTPGSLLQSKNTDSFEEAFVAFIQADRARAPDALPAEGPT